MIVDKTTKKQVINDWKSLFPELSLYSQDKLYKIVGPIIIGLELIKLPRIEKYRPYFVIYPLWKKNVEENFDKPIILKQFYDKKNMQFSIPYENHYFYFSQSVEIIKEQLKFFFEKSVPLDQLLFFIHEYSQTPPLNAAPDSYFQALLQETKFKLALYSNSVVATRVLLYICEHLWDINHFKAFGVDIDQWLNDLKENLFDKSNLVTNVELNAQNKKIVNLKKSEILL